MRDSENQGKTQNKTPPKRRRRKLSKLAYALFMITAVFCAAAVFVIFFLKVKTIEVSGKSMYSTQQIIDASQIKLDSNLLSINKAAVSKRICQALPYIGSVEVKLRPMSTIEIVIAKDSPAYIFKYSGGYIYADQSFKALEILSNTGKNETLPLITGVNATKVQPGSITWFTDKSQQDEIKQIIDALKTTELKHITGINVADSYQISISYDNRISIILGTSLDSLKKLEVAKEIIDTKLQPTDKGELDVSFTGQAVYIYSKLMLYVINY